MDNLFTVLIKIPHGKATILTVSQTQSIFELKKSLSPIFQVEINYQRLIFKSREMLNDFSLGYYKVTPFSRIFLIPSKNQKPPRSKPRELFARLKTLMENFASSNIDTMEAKITEIHEILDNPVMKTFSKLDFSYLQLMESAKDMLDKAQSPFTRKIIQYMAQSQDLTISQYESSPEGERFLIAQYEEEFGLEDEFLNLSQNTEINYPRKLSTTPLPCPWSLQSCGIRFNQLCPNSIENPNNHGLKLSFVPSTIFINMPGNQRSIPTNEDKIDPQIHYIKGDLWPDEDKYILKPTFFEYPSHELKEMYAPQVTQLKDMGFTDENVILEALAQTDGNVQMAALILKSRLQSEC